jgi:hypothetical protein
LILRPAGGEDSGPALAGTGRPARTILESSRQSLVMNGIGIYPQIETERSVGGWKLHKAPTHLHDLIEL